MQEQVEGLNENATDDDFDAGFAAPLEPTTTPAEVVSDPAEKLEDAPKYAQLTEQERLELLAAKAAIDEVKADSKKRLDAAFGQLGGLKQRIEQMQSATPAGEAILATEEDFAELIKDYPDFGKAQMTALNKVLGKMKGTGQAVPAGDMDRIMSQQNQLREQIIDSHLDSVIEGWQDEVKSEAFGKWLNAQPDTVKALAASDNVAHAAKMLRLYQAAKTAKPATQPSTRQKQMEAAVRPKGIGGYTPAPSEDDDFNAGFNAHNS